MQIIRTNINYIPILQFIRKFPDFSVQAFQTLVGKVSIPVGRMFVFVVFVKLLLQKIVLIFMRLYKVPFVDFCLIEFFFQINNQIFNSYNSFFCVLAY